MSQGRSKGPQVPGSLQSAKQSFKNYEEMGKLNGKTSTIS